MPNPRKHQVNLNSTNFYHCISRCVRRAFLCGYDRESQQSFDHRKQWLVEKIQALSDVFSIQICAYAVMSNHYHLVLSVDQDTAESWSTEEVVLRWASLFRMSKAGVWVDIKKDLTTLDESEQDYVRKWREQLYDISWFMRTLNEFIARQANKEDNCTGRFWEGRFKSQALLDESAVLTCMAYVDLNPIRAGIAETPETSDFTSIQERLLEYTQQRSPVVTLCEFEDDNDRPEDASHILPCTREAYFELVDQTGRMVRAGKSGAIPAHLKPLLERLKVNPDTWLDTIKTLGQGFARFLGRPDSLQAVKLQHGSQRMRGIGKSKRVFRRAA